jgi:hypothetical protein
MVVGLRLSTLVAGAVRGSVAIGHCSDDFSSGCVPHLVESSAGKEPAERIVAGSVSKD